MKKVITVVMAIFLSFIVQDALANGAGDVGSVECLQVQEEAQEAVLQRINEGNVRNNGQLVSTAAKVVSGSVCAEQPIISYECASCIMNQFAKGIPIGEQEPCGEEIKCPCWEDGLLSLISADFTLTSCGGCVVSPPQCPDIGFQLSGPNNESLGADIAPSEPLGYSCTFVNSSTNNTTTIAEEITESQALICANDMLEVIEFLGGPCVIGEQ